MDLVKKLTTAIEEMIVAQTGLHLLDFSLVLPSNTRESVENGFGVMPTVLSEGDETTGFMWFRQAFRITLYKKYYKKEAKQKVFELYEALEKILDKIYTLRVAGNNYQVVKFDNTSTTEPDVSDTYVSLELEISALYRRTGLFDGR